MVFAQCAEIIKTVGSTISAIIIIVGAIGVFVKPIRQRVRIRVRTISETDETHTAIKDIHQTQLELKEMTKENHGSIVLIHQAQICVLRSFIKETHHKYMDAKTLPEAEREDIIRMHQAYSALGGNSYVDLLVTEMLSWPVV